MWVVVGSSVASVYSLILAWFGYRVNRTKSDSDLQLLKDPEFAKRPLGTGAGAGILAIRYPRRLLIAGCAFALLAGVAFVAQAVK